MQAQTHAVAPGSAGHLEPSSRSLGSEALQLRESAFASTNPCMLPPRPEMAITPDKFLSSLETECPVLPPHQTQTGNSLLMNRTGNIGER